ncbi:Angiopoietin-1 receptor [Holothuria leucospilota]|uniref:Angiopoietin-1 receptor n=1 Tax=Holothuria leucospilota TaxID=206669 RepID=A0A9Q1H541_HOLLE|nr:Angiopoietin-1 receptor [Holothuria leucospilota]
MFYEPRLTNLPGLTFLKLYFTGILNTRGVFTVTVYPDADGSTTLADVDPIGVAFTPGCRTLQWCKDKRRNVNTGPRLKLTSVDDGGVYTIRRPRRGIRGWFAQIEVIVAILPATACPEGYYDNNGACTAGITCVNGGVLRDKSNDCVCPPFLVTDTCRCNVDDDFILADISFNEQELVCRELPGGNPTCRGHLICFGDLYGCKCSSGWYGNACDRRKYACKL